MSNGMIPSLMELLNSMANRRPVTPCEHNFTGAPERMHSYMPKVRLNIVRDQIDRSVSHFSGTLNAWTKRCRASLSNPASIKTQPYKHEHLLHARFTKP